MPEAVKSFTRDAVRVLVVDDQRFMCIALRQIIEADGDMRVVGEARNGEEACALALELKPDVVTMDVEMPVMDGLAATRRILAELRPPPVIIMVSSHTQAGAAATVEALRLGAADFISKSSAFTPNDLGHIDSELRGKIRACAESRRRSSAFPPVARWVPDAVEQAVAPSPHAPADLIAIAASTGGPATLAALLPAVGRLAVPIVVAQHMPEFFTACLAQSLADDTGLAVREGGDREPLAPNEVTLLPGGKDALVAPRAGGGFELRLTKGAGSVHPSADLLFESAAMSARRPVAVILTGMGDDGTRGAGRFVGRGLSVLVQRPESCVIGGMPAAAIEAGVATEVLSLDQIARRLRGLTQPAARPPRVEAAS
ncbi:MAG TPA: chemotaxis-specific protein-glutamate methyltransferase CheB [Stellaceae bacterium]|jgi:two-component system chemotaxis response regulator CheB